MIALGILTTWLILTAGGFAALSALRRLGAREDVEASITPPGFSTPVFADARLLTPQVLSR
ncbi:MAG TPA: hypothetical protein VGI24_01095 [Solirubrobacteraceae bacterium]|jgi:hypothetical protein